MSLRTRLFMVFGTLLAMMLVGEWFLVQTLTRELNAEVADLAVNVGREVMMGVRLLETGELGAPEGMVLRHEVIKETIDVAVAQDHQGPVFGEEITDPHSEGTPRTVTMWHVGDPEDGSHQVEALEFTLRPGSEVPAASDMHYSYDLSLDRHGTAQARVLVLRGPDAHAARTIPIPEGGLKEALDRNSRRLLLGSFGILGTGLLLAGFLAHKVTAPLRGLTDAARLVGGGELGLQAPGAGDDEVGEAIGSFNRMSRQLLALDAAANDLRAREHLGELGEVARGLAHTLRNPLNALGLSLEELAARAPAGEDSEELVLAARRQIKRIDQSIRSFLALASEGRGELEAVDLKALVQDVALEAMQDNGSAVEVEESGGRPLVRGVAAELRAVIQALVVNAVEASPEGGRVRIRVGEEAAGGARVVVQDEGPGLPRRVREKLFTPHVTTKATGSGMGLFLAHRIATSRYHGSLELRDRQPLGTVAELRLGNRDGGQGEAADG